MGSKIRMFILQGSSTEELVINRFESDCIQMSNITYLRYSLETQT